MCQRTSQKVASGIDARRVNMCVLAVAYNLPKLSYNASWNPNATTVVNNSVQQFYPTSVFLTKTNTWYAASGWNGPILSGIEGSVTRVTNASAGFSAFVTSNDNVYTYDFNTNQVNMWSKNMTSSQPVMFVGGWRGYLFIDTNSILYYSHDDIHQVVAKSLNDPSNNLTVVAGAGCPGSTSDMLTYPNGIFVDLTCILYVADSGNNRIQRFSLGQMNAITIAGNGAPGTINLSSPMAVILDGDGYVFIVDSNNHRIVGSGPDGFRCVIGCTGSSGSALNQLNYPQSMSFDSYGNIWVADGNNGRIQKFLLQNNSYGEHHLYFYNLLRHDIIQWHLRWVEQNQQTVWVSETHSQLRGYPRHHRDEH